MTHGELDAEGRALIEEELRRERERGPYAPVEPANPIPPSIVMAIAAVMSSMQAVHKSQENKHAGYKYASTDDIYAAITKKMGEIGFVIIALEESPPEIKMITSKDGKATQWMRVCHQFILATKDATWTDRRNRKTVTVRIDGPQSFQGAQSYNEKAFLRSLFKIPTGDMDLESLGEGFEFNPVQFNAPKAPPPAPAGAEDSLKSDAEMLKEMSGLLNPTPPLTPPPDMKEVLKNVEAVMAKAPDTKALNAIVESFNRKYDGYIDQQVGANLDVLYDINTTRLTKKK